MGTIVFDKAIEFSGMISETIGMRAGVGLNLDQMSGFLSDYSGENYFDGDMYLPIRVHSIDVEAILCHLYYRLGAIESPEVFNIFQRSQRKYLNTKLFPAFLKVSTEMIKYMRVNESGPVDMDRFLDRQIKKKKLNELEVTVELLQGLVEDLRYRTPWTPPVTTVFSDPIMLAELFENESLKAKYGKFFDQRFIDYLSRNFNDIDIINWRKFEGLVGEYFDRSGCHVEMGPGRNDDGVDIRITDVNVPNSLVIVQCKRQKQKISKTVVKSLWADVLHEGADRGLIITTSELSPGAKTVCESRSYRINEVMRSDIQKWLNSMKSPSAGFYYL